jgi:uncharacterized membrane protein YdjX (TVP38/TMEM64 family)
MTREQRQFAVKAGAALVVVGLLVVGARLLPLGQWMQQFTDWVKGHGTLGILVFAGAYAVGTIFFFPASLFTLAGPVAFGFWQGLLISWVSASLGAAAPFFIARYFARGLVEQQIARNEKLQIFDTAIAREGWKIILLLRLTPIFPFPVTNYFAGLTKIRFWPYFWASSLGIIPGLTFYTYLGYIGKIAFGEKRQRTPQEYVFLGIGLIATMVVLVFVTRLAKRSLNEIERRHREQARSQPANN